jgi:hypothetical protein
MSIESERVSIMVGGPFSAYGVKFQVNRDKK